MRTAFALNYNSEEGISAIDTNEEPPFGLGPATLMECRSRTTRRSGQLTSLSVSMDAFQPPFEQHIVLVVICAYLVPGPPT